MPASWSWSVARVHFTTRSVAAGSVITWSKLNKITRDAAELLAAYVVEGIAPTE